MADLELSPSQAARHIGTTTRTVQRWIANGTLPARRVGGRWRVASDALDAFAGTKPVVAEPAVVEPAVVEPVMATPRIAAPVLAAPSIRHLFVANRGEIARRIARTCNRLGIRVTVPLTSGPAPLNLLDTVTVVQAACAAGADAVHPGFGFLAESPDFAEAVGRAGMRWVGPPPAAMRAMGDKAAARRLAAALGVPVVPGYDDGDQSVAALDAAAASIGYPLIVKPAAGGGGKGMRMVHDPDRFADACESARREAMVAFGDDRLVLEHLVEGARHIEIQVLFDAHGAGVHLGERDCSFQRRHQKVLEESPSPGLEADVRMALGQAALALAGAVGYEGAGTCEFLVTDRGPWFFLEMNTRLQVEHPVTELVTGRDLVADQLRIAVGEPLGVTQADVDMARAAGGHAIEVRLYAEDAEHGFLPATGYVERLRWPSGEGIRIDAGVDQGDEITGRFDPMLAKVIAGGRTRDEALTRLIGALDQTLILGLTTNLRFLRWLAREPVLATGQAHIDTLDRIWPPDDLPARTSIPDTAWAAAAGALGIGGWRLNAPPRVGLTADDGSERVLEMAPPTDAVLDVAVGERGDDRVAHVDVDGRSVGFRVAPPPDVDRTARAAKAHHARGPVEIAAPMPGSVLAVHVTIGQAVAPGDPVATLEAMKMEHVVTVSISGTVAELFVRAADQVRRGQALAVIEP